MPFLQCCAKAASAAVADKHEQRFAASLE